MKIYNYSGETGEFIKESIANKSPLEKDAHLMPANSTKIKPPIKRKNKINMFVNDNWKQFDDFRGSEYWTADGVYHVHDTLGPLPDIALHSKPEKLINKKELIILIKREASRRILKICPEWKQANLLAQAAILNDKGRDNWTEKELSSWDAGMFLWANIDKIRKASDKLEENPISNYEDDSNWL